MPASRPWAPLRVSYLTRATRVVRPLSARDILHTRVAPRPRYLMRAARTRC